MKKITIIFLIFGLGLFLRLYKINIPLLDFEPSRQIQTADITRNIFLGRFDILHPSVNYYGPGKVQYLLEFPGYNTAIAFFYLIVGKVNDTLGRIFSIVGWMLSFFFLYQISKKLIGEKFSSVTMLFYSLSPMSIFVSRSFQPDQWMIALSLGAVNFALIWLKSKKIVFLLLSAIFASLASLLKIPSLIFTAIPVFFLILSLKKSRRLINMFLYSFISFAPSFLWYAYAYFASKTSVVSSHDGFLLSNWFWPNLFLKVNYYTTVFGWNYNQVILPVGFILFCIGIFSGGKKLRFAYIWLASIAVYFFIFNRHTMVHEYYNLPFLPIASIFITVGFMAVLKIFKNNLLLYCFVVATVLINALPQLILMGYKPIERFKYVQETGGEIQKITKPDDLIVGAMDSGPALVYYSNRTGWGFDITGKNNPIIDGKTLTPEEYLESLRSKGAVIFAAADVQRFMSNPAFLNYLLGRYKTLAFSEKYAIFDLSSQN